MRVFGYLRLVLAFLQRVKRHFAYRPQRLPRQIVPPDVKPAPVGVKVRAHVIAARVPQLHNPNRRQPRHGRVPLLVHVGVKNPPRLQILPHRDVVAHVRVYLETLFVFAHVLRVLVQLTQRLRDNL